MNKHHYKQDSSSNPQKKTKPPKSSYADLGDEESGSSNRSSSHVSRSNQGNNVFLENTHHISQYRRQQTQPLLYPLSQGNFDILYSEYGDGEILIDRPEESGNLRLITCIDISTLYKEKRAKAIEMARQFSKLSHPNLLCMTQDFELVGENNSTLMFYTESPDHIAGWKSYCKKKFTTNEMLQIFRQLCQGLAYLHSQNLIHRDVHPTRIHSTYGLAKFNLIGMPYNYKKLLKKDNFCGHVNYSAPELIQEKIEFTPKVDIWSLGCCLYYLCTKKDPFEGRTPQEIKQNIMQGKLEKYNNNFPKIDPILQTLIHKCLERDENKRLDAQGMLEFMDKLEIQTYGAPKSGIKVKEIRERYEYFMQNPFEAPIRLEPENLKLLNGKYKNPEYFINQRPNQTGAHDTSYFDEVAHDDHSHQNYSYNEYSQDISRDTSSTNITYKSGIYKDYHSSYNRTQFQQNYKQYKQQSQSDESSIGSYARHSVKQNFQNNLNSYYKKQLQHQQYNKMNHAFNDNRQPQYWSKDTYSNQHSTQVKVYDGDDCMDQQQDRTLLPTKQSIQESPQLENTCQIREDIQSPNAQFDLTQKNLDKFNQQFDHYPKQQDLKVVQSSVSEVNKKTDQRTAAQEDKEPTTQVNHSADQIKKQNSDEGEEDNMPYSIFKNECIFMDNLNTNSSDRDVHNDSDLLKDAIIQEDPSSNESRNEMNKDEIEGIVAQIVESSKRVKNQIHFADGTKYVGEVHRHGHGIFYDQDGSIYDGQWYEDQKYGRGKMLYPDGSIYDGMWEADKMHGRGVYIASNGDRYEGDFFQGVKDGQGAIHYKNGNSYAGQWRKDAQSGIGTFTFKNGNFYKGNFQNGLFEGHGMMVFVGVGTFNGCFSGGNIQGIGKFQYENGALYDGNWMDNKKHGKGKFIESDGMSIYNGDWENDVKHGKGTFIQNGTCIIEGVWQHGDLIEMTKFHNNQ